MGFVIKRLSRMQGQWFFRSWAGHATIFGQVQNFPARQGQELSREVYPRPNLTPPIVRRGGLNARPFFVLCGPTSLAFVNTMSRTIPHLMHWI
jgi:hypothetical protein